MPFKLMQGALDSCGFGFVSISCSRVGKLMGKQANPAEIAKSSSEMQMSFPHTWF